MSNRISKQITTTISREISLFCKERKIPIAELIRVGYGLMKYPKQLNELNLSVRDSNVIVRMLCNKLDLMKESIESIKEELIKELGE
jgi:hypothetical protein